MENWQTEYMTAMCRYALESRGIQIEIVRDTQRAVRLMGELGKSPSQVLNPQANAFTINTAFWMFAFESGKVVMGGGVRVDDLGSEDLGSFLERSLPVTFGVEPKPAASKMFSKRLEGRAAYFGDLVSNKAFGLTRGGRDAIRLFTAYGHHRSYTDLAADFTYCFVRGRDWRRASAYGFLDTDPFIWETDKMMYKDGNPEWIGHLHKSRLPSLLMSVSALFVDPLAKDKKPFLASKGANATCGSDERKPHMTRA